MTLKVYYSKRERILALLYGAAAHTVFVIAVFTMIYALLTGLQIGLGRVTGWQRIAWNSALLLQFPLFHSLLLSSSGRQFLNALAPSRVSKSLQPTTYVIVSSIQLLCVFVFWSPLKVVLWQPEGVLYYLHLSAYTVSWLLLGKSMYDAHLGIQTGYIGWLSIWQNKPSIVWPGLAVGGLFKICRQPIYLSFSLTLWTSPVWTFDKIYLGSLWTLYCFLGPFFKERRFGKIYGELFEEYKKKIPYWPLFR